MKGRRSLAAFFLGVGLSFVPVSGYGEVKPLLYLAKPSSIDWRLLQATVTYMQENPTNFLWVHISYDPDGSWGKHFFPRGVDTKGRICVLIGDDIFRGDSKGAFYGKSGIDLLDDFKRQLEIVYSFIDDYATDMDTDIVAYFYTREKMPSLVISLGYFYQGEYHLGEKG